MSIKNLILLPIAILTFSCSNTKKTDLPSGEIMITMDPFDLPPTAKLSGIVKEVRIVPLETGPGLLMDYTDKVFVGDEHILVSTEGSKSELFHFDPDGNFINKIGKTGKGPGEYPDIREFTAFEDSMIVYVSPMGARKILKYKFDGALITEIPNPKGYRENQDFEYPGDLLEQIESMTVEDNPVLVFYTFK